MFRSSTVKKKDEDPAHALNAALRLLTRREYSILELYTKLSQKYTKEAVKDALKNVLITAGSQNSVIWKCSLII